MLGLEECSVSGETVVYRVLFYTNSNEKGFTFEIFEPVKDFSKMEFERVL